MSVAGGDKHTGILAFTEHGYTLAQTIAELTGGEAQRCVTDMLHRWTGAAFEEYDTLIFVGATGIAVRAIAPFLKNKATDPAVLVVDETGRYVIPLVSGHLGGANERARKLADRLGAQAVITTATDLRNVFAVDVWAKSQGCVLPDTSGIRTVSGALLRGETVVYATEFPIAGEQPAGLAEGDCAESRFVLSVHTVPQGVLACVPKILTLGIGCKKGIAAEQIREQVFAVLEREKLQPAAIQKVCSIDRKKDEPGLVNFCHSLGLEPETFSAEQLKQVTGDFSHSGFVENTVGVDNVCERSAVCGSGGTLLVAKSAANGVTVAIAQADYAPHW